MCVAVCARVRVRFLDQVVVLFVALFAGNYDEDASEDSGEGGGKGGGLEEKMVNQPRGTVKVLLHMHRASLFAVYTM
eukprot:SAG31_NODE_2371_length_5851_cov_4.577886_1_plen_77_part_00